MLPIADPSRFPLPCLRNRHSSYFLLLTSLTSSYLLTSYLTSYLTLTLLTGQVPLRDRSRRGESGTGPGTGPILLSQATFVLAHIANSGPVPLSASTVSRPLISLW